MFVCMVLDTFSDAACAGSIAGFDTLNAAGAESIAVLLVCGVLNAASTGSMSSTSTCLLYTSPSPRDGLLTRMPSSA